MTKFRVHFPGMTTDLIRDFDNEDAAERFANCRRDASKSMWRHVRVEKIQIEE